MRILWVGKQPGDGTAGDEIFDARAIASVRALGHDVVPFHPRRVSRASELLNHCRLVPHPRTRYASAANAARLAAAAEPCDAIVCSWEPFDALALRLARPVFLILHNITSTSLPSLYPGNPAVALLARRAALWERRAYRRQGALRAIGLLAQRDLAYVEGIAGAPPLLYLPPGMPKPMPLAADAVLQPELVISGTFEWKPKKRDIIRFARELADATEFPVHADRLPAAAGAALGRRGNPISAQCPAAIRLGVITDRFESGHKLKTLAYIAANNIVLSYADVSADFAHIADHTLFIRRVASVEDIRRHARELQQIPQDLLRQRFRRFKERCAASFTWDAVGHRLMRAIEAGT